MKNQAMEFRLTSALAIAAARLIQAEAVRCSILPRAAVVH